METNATVINYDQDLRIEDLKHRKALEIAEKTGMDIDLLKGLLREGIRLTIEKKQRREADVHDAEFARFFAEQLRTRKYFSAEKFRDVQMLFGNFILAISVWYDEVNKPAVNPRPLSSARSRNQRKNRRA